MQHSNRLYKLFSNLIRGNSRVTNQSRNILQMTLWWIIGKNNWLIGLRGLVHLSKLSKSSINFFFAESLLETMRFMRLRFAFTFLVNHFRIILFPLFILSLWLSLLLLSFNVFIFFVFFTFIITHKFSYSFIFIFFILFLLFHLNFHIIGRCLNLKHLLIIIPKVYCVLIHFKS